MNRCDGSYQFAPKNVSATKSAPDVREFRGGDGCEQFRNMIGSTFRAQHNRETDKIANELSKLKM